MSSIKCAECGLVNFASALECKRCHVRLYRPESGRRHKPIIDTSASTAVPLAPTETRSSIGYPIASPEEAQHKAPLEPLPDYFINEPAPYSVPVIIFAILLTLTVLAVGYQLKFFFSFIDSPEWRSMTSPRSVGVFYTPALESVFYVELLVKSTVFSAALVLLILLKRKSWSFLKWVRVYLLAGLVFQGVELVALRSLRASLPGRAVGRPFNVLLENSFWTWYTWLVVGTVLLSLLWLGYFSISKRVRKIFID